MREIKFRAWHKILEAWCEVQAIKLTKPCKGSIMCNGQSVDADEIILMQFTGLKDKNGKEIYEGDTVKIKPMYLGIVNGVVSWNKSHASYQVEALDTRWLFDGIESFEIIGNIHQHPNLLEQQE